MSIQIELTPADRKLLCRYVTPESGLREKLVDGKATTHSRLTSEPSNPVECTESQAFELLRIANDCYSPAVAREIKKGIMNNCL